MDKFAPLLKPFPSNDYTIKDTFDLTTDISQQNSKLFMASLDVDSLFTNAPLDIWIICLTELFKKSQTVSGPNKQVSDVFVNYQGKNYYIG